MPSFDLFRGRAPRRFDTALQAVEDQDLRRGIVELFAQARARAQAGEVDVVVLAARRLACVYQLLVDRGMEPLTSHCDVVSDRFLDVPGPWSWRKVIVLDDSVVVGTTLLRIHGEISERIADDGRVSCLAVCVDTEQSADYLLKEVGLDSLFNRSSAE